MNYRKGSTEKKKRVTTEKRHMLSFYEDFGLGLAIGFEQTNSVISANECI